MIIVLFFTILLFVFIIGLCIGSFLNVVILRALSNESIVYPASKCPKCGQTLLWWHNIPVLSYILLRGKCGFCGEKISIQYPVVELLTGLMFAILFLEYGNSWDTLFGWIVGSLLIVIAGTDWREKVVFDMHTYLLMGAGLVYSIIATGYNIYQNYAILGGFQFSTEWLVNNPVTGSLLGIIIGFVLLEAVARLGYLAAGTRAFGEGDSFIAAGLGSVFGWKALIGILILSVIIQFIITLPVFIKKEIDNRNWMTVLFLAAFIIYTAAFFMAQQFGWLANSTAYTASALVLAGLGIFTCREILIGIKNPENRTYLPFGPAMILAGFVILLL